MTETDSSHASSAATCFRPVVIAPTYNNAATLVGVLERIEKIGVPIIVVDDGSTDETPDLLTAWIDRDRSIDVKVLTHAPNQGKAAALATGFADARETGFSHAVTMDTDAQLEPEDIPAMLDAAAHAPRALVLGRRSESTPGLPKSNLVGWRCSGMGLWVETGLVIHDSQCGLRVYPLDLLDSLRCWAGRFGFEAEIIARTVWAGRPIATVPVICHYPPLDQSVSHFKPFRDGAKGFMLHWALGIRRLIPWPLFPPKPSDGPTAGEGDMPPGGVLLTPPTGWATWRTWASPLALWRQIRSSEQERFITSAAVGFGAFMACWSLGAWTIVAIAYTSKRLNHNLWATLLGAMFALPPLGPALGKLAITIAYVPTHLALPPFDQAAPGVAELGTIIRTFPFSWCAGSFILGTALHWVALATALFVMRLAKRRVRS